MKHFIFFKSFKNTEVVPPIASLKALPGQTITTPSGNSHDVEPDWRVGVFDLSVAQSYPLGTVFCVDSFKVIVNASRHQYSIKDKDYQPVSCAAKHAPEEPSDEAVEEFKRYESAHPNWNAAEGGLFDETVSEPAAAPKPAPKKAVKVARTVLEQILSDFPTPSVDKDSFYVNPDTWQQLVRNVRFRKRPTLITGPTGTGKTELVALIGKILGLKVHVYDMGSMHDPLAQLIGIQSLTAGTMGSVTKFQYSQFTRDIQEPGIILLDEINRAPGTANNILMPLLDSRRKLFVEMAGEGEQREIAVHPDCVFVATANLGSIYTATEIMDEAFKDRLNVISLDYLPSSVECSLLMNRTHIDSKSAQAIADVCSQVRQKYQENKVSRPLSTRESLLAAEFVEDGWKLKNAMELAFLPLFDGEGGVTSERCTIKNLILAK